MDASHSSAVSTPPRRIARPVPPRHTVTDHALIHPKGAASSRVATTRATVVADSLRLPGARRYGHRVRP